MLQISKKKGLIAAGWTEVAPKLLVGAIAGAVGTALILTISTAGKSSEINEFINTAKDKGLSWSRTNGCTGITNSKLNKGMNDSRFVYTAAGTVNGISVVEGFNISDGDYQGIVSCSYAPSSARLALTVQVTNLTNELCMDVANSNLTQAFGAKDSTADVTLKAGGSSTINTTLLGDTACANSGDSNSLTFWFARS